MFDIGFSELLLIAVVALVVLGPERLPKVARTMGAMMGRLNRYVADVKQDVERDMQLAELRKMQQDMQAQAQRFEIVAEETAGTIQKEVSQVDKVMQAMAVTDGGLAAQEYDKLKQEGTGEVSEPELASLLKPDAQEPEHTPTEAAPSDSAQLDLFAEPQGKSREAKDA